MKEYRDKATKQCWKRELSVTSNAFVADPQIARTVIPAKAGRFGT